VLLELTGVAMKKKQTTRVYGTSFQNKRFNRILALLEEASAITENWEGIRIICFSQKVGQGLPLWLKGCIEKD
jgi:threonyl-tRNA synthetase